MLNRLLFRCRAACALALLVFATGASASSASAPPLPATSLPELAGRLAVGDLVFIDVPVTPFRKVAEATLSWTNHVGVVIETGGAEPVIAESTFPLSRRGPLSRFIARSAAGRVAVSRLAEPLTAAQQQEVTKAARARLGVRYDTGFDLASKGQFCSRFAREVLLAATGVAVGEVEDFATLLKRNPAADLAFWQAWYFGRIPWQRRTVTPASLLESPRLQAVFDGHVSGEIHRSKRGDTRRRPVF